MLFSQWITVPASTESGDPHVVRVKVGKGTLQKVWVLIPIPSAWCCGIQIWYASWQMWPTTRGEWIPGGMIVVELDENVEIDQPPLEFEVRAYNEDTVNEHKIWIGFNVIRPVMTSRMEELVVWLAGR